MLASNSNSRPSHLLSLRIKDLSNILENILASPTLPYYEIRKTDQHGLYLIFDNTTIMYVGKTNRKGKLRLQELTADFRSHTLNNKLLSLRLRTLGLEFKSLKSATKQSWIESGSMTEDDFRQHQKAVNNLIRDTLHFRFYPVENQRELIMLEHFAIAVLAPPYND